MSRNIGQNERISKEEVFFRSRAAEFCLISQTIKNSVIAENRSAPQALTQKVLQKLLIICSFLGCFSKFIDYFINLVSVKYFRQFELPETARSNLTAFFSMRVIF
jgi:hypothetical protein